MAFCLRKNEFRKKRAKKQGYTVTVTPSLPVSVPLSQVNVLKISIPSHVRLLISSTSELGGRLQMMPVVSYV